MIAVRFRNKKTGAVIDVPSEINGANWEKIDGGAKPAVISQVEPETDDAEPVKKPARRKKKS